MKATKFLVLLLAVEFGFTTVAFAQNIGQETRDSRRARENDDQAVRTFVESKENIDIRKKANNLQISGEVRFEWTYVTEKGMTTFADESSSGIGFPSNLSEKYRNLRGWPYIDNEGLPLSHNDWDIEFKLNFKYSFEKAFAVAQLQFDNPAGTNFRACKGNNLFPIFNKKGNRLRGRLDRDQRWDQHGSGSAAFINLKRAYIGYNVYADGKHRVDLEVGRRKFSDVFDSEIEFGSRFDGILFKYSCAIDKVMDWYIDVAGFVIDERVDHYGWVTEIGLLNIYQSGWDVRYSLIDWRRRKENRCFVKNPLGSQFLNSQITLAYKFKAPFPLYAHKLPGELYGGFLVNHAAKKTEVTRNKRANLGWYVGLLLGHTRQQGEWSLDIEYLYVQAQAVADFDNIPLARGNIFGENLADIVNDFPNSGLGGYHIRRGNLNCQGWSIEFLYALTDNLTLDTKYEMYREIDRKIGGPHYYSAFEIEAVYAF